MPLTFYPKSPTNIPKKLTSLPSSYKFRATLAVLAIILFFLLYTTLIIGLGYLAYYAITYDMERINKITIVLKIGAIAGSVMLFIFTLKFIFKLKNHKRTNRIKLVKKEQPDLWAFIDEICRETGAPKPKAIYVDPDVNAYVSYSNMWLSLFLPVKKELTIGLGLVSCLNLSEFKAVISHEFGHFAQSSMKIGSYIISANTIIHDMIFERDKWDDLLDQWRGSDIRLSFAAWLITPIVWVIRQLLRLFYQFLNIMYSSLSREMEFNADKVAVSTTGSDAIVSALWKLDDGSTNWNNTINNTYLASQKKMFVKNLYTHNLNAIERGKNKQEATLSNLPEDTRGGKKYFSNSENSKVHMYASHPPNDLREQNAKVPYLACEPDPRSPWILFGSDIALQEKMTALYYDEYFQKSPQEFCKVEDFEQFIKDENQGKDLHEAYDHTFENRFIYVPNAEELEMASKDPMNNISGAIDTLKSELKLLMTPVKTIEQLMSKAVNISNGTSVEKTFSFKGETFKKKNLQEGYEKLVNEREKLFNESFKEWDIKFFGIHIAKGAELGIEKKLNDIYLQHKEITSIYKSLVAIKSTIYSELNHIQSRTDVSKMEVSKFEGRIKDLVSGMNLELDKLDALNFVPLPNIDNLQELKEAITEDGAFQRYKGRLFEGDGFPILMNQIENAMIHCQRVEQKSIGAILLLHEGMYN